MRRIHLFLLIQIVFILGCGQTHSRELEINTKHLDHLYQEIEINKIQMAIIHIYSNYPNYNYLDDEDEGTACVDDAARASVFYLKNYFLTSNIENIDKNKKLLKFLIYMQSKNGYFYNFIFSDHSINKEFKTSIAEPNWWSWRALWALSESYTYYKSYDTKFAEEILASIISLINAVKKDIPTQYDYEDIAGIKIPNWLPYKHAADQASILLLGLVNYYNEYKDETLLNYIKMLTNGLVEMQIRDKNSEYYGAFLSWQNTWHSWGNCQAYALLKSFEILQDDKILNSVLLELNDFYPKLIKIGYLNSFEISCSDSTISIINEKKYPQIAYNIRPMIYALLEASDLTKEIKYKERAAKIAKWFLGKNPNSIKLYDKNTGIVFDGIESEKKVNKNSGAESTIEALLSLLEINARKLSLNEINH